MKRKLTALLAAAALCLSLTIPASAAGSFADVSPTRDAWCYTQVMQASEAGLMNGYGSSLFETYSGVSQRRNSALCLCQMRRKRLIRPTNSSKFNILQKSCRPDKRSASGNF